MHIFKEREKKERKQQQKRAQFVQWGLRPEYLQKVIVLPRKKRLLYKDSEKNNHYLYG